MIGEISIVFHGKFYFSNQIESAKIEQMFWLGITPNFAATKDSLREKGAVMAQLSFGESAQQTYEDIRGTIVQSRGRALAAVNHEMVCAYWKIGKRIVEEQGERAEYGKRLIEYLSARLTEEFGKGFDRSNLRNMRKFYLAFPIRDALRRELSWTHYRLIMKLKSVEQREFYMHEAADENWSSRQLSRQINAHYFERLLSSSPSCASEARAAAKALVPRARVDEVIKDPYVLDFLDLSEDNRFAEKDLEQAIIDRLQLFLLELGKGFSFVARQKRISDGEDDYFIDLVFYNYHLKCFVLIDLKTGKLTPQDVGQMDFYMRLYEDKFRLPEDNPPIGIILCSNKNKTVARYSALADSKGLFASEYVLYLPSEEELANEVEAAALHHELQREAD